MRLLVTGGAGFIGSSYVRAVLSGAYPGTEGARVTVVDALTYAGNRANLEADRPGLTFVHGDIGDADLLMRVLPGHDAVVHFAAESHVDRSIAGAARFMTTNVLGTHTLLECARRAGVARFVHVSTDEVYGSVDTGAWREDEALAPNSPYAASKAASDLLVRAFHRTHGLDVRITRGSNTYGPRQYPEKIIPLFVTNLLDGLDVPLYGDGLHEREWLHVDDHCRGIHLALTRGRAGEIYNIGGGTRTTNRELTARLLAATGASWDRVRHVRDREGHDRRYALDTCKASGELGFTPQVAFARGLTDTVAWYARHRAWWEPVVRAARRGATGDARTPVGH